MAPVDLENKQHNKKANARRQSLFSSNYFYLASPIIMGNANEKEMLPERSSEEQYFGSYNEDGQRHGYGTLLYPSGDERKTYNGQFVNGKREGNGVLEWENGSFYRGNWKNDEIEGLGYYSIPHVLYYEGEFVQSHFNGAGVCYWLKENKRYEGNWKDNKQNGFGVLTFSPNDKQQRSYYRGEWLDNKRNGYGVMKWNSGAAYEGNWTNGKREGIGKYTFASGEIHNGSWKNGKRNGAGVKLLANGDRMEGTWIKDKKVGPAKYTYGHGRVVNQFFENGKLISGPIQQEVPSLQVLCIEAIARQRKLRKHADEALPEHLNTLIHTRADSADSFLDVIVKRIFQ